MCVAVCCSVLQCVAVCCSMLQNAAYICHLRRDISSETGHEGQVKGREHCVILKSKRAYHVIHNITCVFLIHSNTQYKFCGTNVLFVFVPFYRVPDPRVIYSGALSLFLSAYAITRVSISKRVCHHTRL